jgi:hypothetical protein
VCDRRIDVVAGNRPCGESSGGDPIEAERAVHRRRRFLDIGSDDVQIRSTAERKQGVVRAEADVLAGRLCAHAEVPDSACEALRCSVV